MKIIELHLLSNDLVNTATFYNEILGLPIVYQNDSAIKFSAGTSSLIFKRTFDIDPFYHFAFNIPASKFEAAFGWLISKLPVIQITPSIDIADFKSWNAKAFYFYDNNNNIVEMIARFDLDNNSALPFSGESICCVSEIGLVVDDAATYGLSIMEAYGVSYFSKQVPQPGFVALGDDDGLLIVVDKNRDWYPTKIKSKPFCTSVIIDQNNTLHELQLNCPYNLV